MINRPCKYAYALLIRLRQYKKFSLEDLYNIIENKGFKIVLYKKYNYKDDFKSLIEKLNIEDEIQRKDAFLYIKGNLKFVFVNMDISDYDKWTLLVHEIGHIYDSRMFDSEIMYNNIQRENYANEFSHYLTHPSVAIKALSFILRKPIFFIVTLTVIGMSCFGYVNYNYKNKDLSVFSNNNDQLSNELYYVTQTGNKYHKSFCKYVKYKTNIAGYSFEEVVSKGYEPCLDCIGEEVK